MIPIETSEETEIKLMKESTHVLHNQIAKNYWEIIDNTSKTQTFFEKIVS